MESKNICVRNVIRICILAICGECVNMNLDLNVDFLTEKENNITDMKGSYIQCCINCHNVLFSLHTINGKTILMCVNCEQQYCYVGRN